MVLLPGLKVKRKWIKIMREGIQRRGERVKKTMEVRKYPPFRYTPRGQPPIQIGGRLFLISDGRLCGSARLASMIVFDTMQKFAESEHLHCVFLDHTSCSITLRFQELLQSNVQIFGWQFDDFHWFHPEMRSGENEIPDFKGQRYGQVWSTVRIDDAFDYPYDVSHSQIMHETEGVTDDEQNLPS